VALLVAVVAVLLVIQASGGSEDSDGETATTPSAQETTPTTPRREARQRASYTVKLNDTLTVISEKTGVSVERIETLNPDLDPQNLIVGQKIKLRE
jgi:LysM repeat protein